MNAPTPTPPDETTLTEITLQPDGRIYVFGTSRNVLELLADLQPNDERLRQLLRHAAGPSATEDPPP